MLGVGLALTSVGALGSRAFHPRQLPGLIALYDISDLSSLFVERTGASATTPAQVGGVVGTVRDLSGNGHHLTAPSDAARPILRTGSGFYWLESDGVDDYLRVTLGGIQFASVALRELSGIPDFGTYLGVSGVVNGVHLSIDRNPQTNAILYVAGQASGAQYQYRVNHAGPFATGSANNIVPRVDDDRVYCVQHPMHPPSGTATFSVCGRPTNEALVPMRLYAAAYFSTAPAEIDIARLVNWMAARYGGES